MGFYGRVRVGFRGIGWGLGPGMGNCGGVFIVVGLSGLNYLAWWGVFLHAGC